MISYRPKKPRGTGKTENDKCFLRDRPCNPDHVLILCNIAFTKGGYTWRDNKMLEMFAHWRELKRWLMNKAPKENHIQLVKAGQHHKTRYTGKINQAFQPEFGDGS